MNEQITTAAELDALPVGSVVLDRDGDAWQKSSKWFCAAPPEWSLHKLSHYLPATVLYRPDRPALTATAEQVEAAERTPPSEDARKPWRAGDVLVDEDGGLFFVVEEAEGALHALTLDGASWHPGSIEGARPLIRVTRAGEVRITALTVEQVRQEAKAEALQEFADSTRFPSDWILFRRDDGSGVTVSDLLRSTAANIAQGGGAP
ncbi:hypothetical protein [Ruania rhizosphaerae]|uniref:hypothetical protein n=1 Tax=Ruania rhizosphaerae TaxID=1840413 RepID=UPI0013597670|nr:hypothetical protein [Ruania rhizosphaerae]